MEKKFKLKTDGQPLSMPCTKEQWEAIKPELDEIEGVGYGTIKLDSFKIQFLLVNNVNDIWGEISNISLLFKRECGRTYLETHDKEAFLSSLRGEPIVKEEVKKPVTFNDEYWEKLYHECAMRLYSSGERNTVSSAINSAKNLIEELKNNPLK